MYSIPAIQGATRLLSSVWPQCKTALHFVAVRKPQSQILRYTVAVARLAYVANVISGISITLYAVAKCDKKELDIKTSLILAGGAVASLVPGLGFAWTYVLLKD